MVDDESHLTNKPVSGRVLQASGDVKSLASATHCFMSPLCYSRSFRRAIMEAVRRSRALRCLTTYRAPIELRQLNGTGFALMCSVTTSPPAFTRSAPLFVYAKARAVTLQPVWPSNLPECDRSDIVTRASPALSEKIEFRGKSLA